MGHSRKEKSASRDRIVRAASARVREVGIDGVGVSDLMNDAGLTHGGFYRHFASRDDLVAEAVDHLFLEGKAVVDGLTAALHDGSNRSAAEKDRLKQSLAERLVTPPAALTREGQKRLVKDVTDIVTRIAGDPTQAERTWVILTEAAEGGWGMLGTAFGRDEFAALAAKART